MRFGAKSLEQGGQRAQLLEQGLRRRVVGGVRAVADGGGEQLVQAPRREVCAFGQIEHCARVVVRARARHLAHQLPRLADLLHKCR